VAAIHDILGWRNISASVQKVRTGIPDPLPAEFSSVSEDVLGDRTTYVTFRGQRQVARRAEYGGPSRARKLQPVGDQSVTLLHFAEHIKLQQELVLRLRQAGDLLAQQKAQEFIAYQGAQFRTLFDNTRIAARILALSKGKIWFDANGYVLPTSSGADLTVDFSIPANNQNQLNGIIDASWATASTNIVQHIENIKVQAVRTTGRPIDMALYGANIANYLLTNTTAKAYFQFNPVLYQQFQANPGTLPDGLFGIRKWVRMAESFMEDSSGTVQPLWDPDLITFCPAVTRDWWTMFQGSLAVPKTFGVYKDADAALADVEIVYGMGGYAVLEIDPVNIKEVLFDTFMPTIKTGADVYQADVTP
jgi:hypothetical protein